HGPGCRRRSESRWWSSSFAAPRIGDGLGHGLHACLGAKRATESKVVLAHHQCKARGSQSLICRIRFRLLDGERARRGAEISMTLPEQSPEIARPAAPTPHADAGEIRRGVIAALAAYLLWGFLPILFRLLEAAGAVLIVAERTVWSRV